MTNFNDVLNRFVELLEERLRLNILTKEDAVRYTFFLALTETDYCRHTDMVLEKPHDTINNAEVDTYIQASNGNLPAVIEFKYARVPVNSTQPKTDGAGAVFKDMCRLAHFHRQERLQRYFVYLTDGGMKTYFSNPKNGLKNIFDLEGQDLHPITKDFILDKPKTFKKGLATGFL